MWFKCTQQCSWGTVLGEMPETNPQFSIYFVNFTSGRTCSRMLALQKCAKWRQTINMGEDFTALTKQVQKQLSYLSVSWKVSSMTQGKNILLTATDHLKQFEIGFLPRNLIPQIIQSGRKHMLVVTLIRVLHLRAKLLWDINHIVWLCLFLNLNSS